MAQLIQTGEIFRPTPSGAVLRDELPAAVYTMEHDDRGYHFKCREPFRKLPAIYGDHSRWAQRILDTFFRKDGNMGVLLSGEKGGGKSLLGKLVALEAAKQGMATVLVEDSHSPRELGKLLAALSSPALVFIDEFEKIYSSIVSQEEFLSLLDGTSGIRHLFLFTVNEPRAVSHHMLNRPGRIHYRIDFDGLDESFIRSYCADRLEHPEELQAILLIASCFDSFNFDQLSALVEEINRYGETALEAVRLLNISPSDLDRRFSVSVLDAQGELQKSNSHWHGNPHTAELFRFEHWPAGDRSWPIELTVGRVDAIRFDPVEDVYIFSKDGYTITLRGEKTSGAQPRWWETLAQGLEAHRAAEGS